MQFKPGQSGNPGGRTKAHREVARYIREQTNSGKGLADVHLAIARGTPILRLQAKDGTRYAQLGGKIPDGSELLDVVWPDIKEMQNSVDYCTDRGLGKAVLPIELREADEAKVDAPIDWDAVPFEQRKRLLNALREIDSLQRLTVSTDGDNATEH